MPVVKEVPEWREIPGFSSYLASSHGQIRHKRKAGLSKLYEVPTSKGSYLRASALSDCKAFRSKEVHHLVCLAFHGLPPSDDYEVNHVDGDKHNNRFDNLEWSTRGDNLIHAYKEGLRKENRRILVTDHTKGVVTEFYSMTALGKAFGVPKGGVWALITNHRLVPFDGRFTFEFIKGTTQSNKRSTTRIVYAMDYRSKTLHVYDNLAELELAIGIKRGTAAYHLKRDTRALVKGFVFSYSAEVDHFPEYDKIQIESSMFKTVTQAPGSA